MKVTGNVARLLELLNRQADALNELSEGRPLGGRRNAALLSAIDAHEEMVRVADSLREVRTATKTLGERMRERTIWSPGRFGTPPPWAAE